MTTITVYPNSQPTQAPRRACKIFITPHAVDAYRERIYRGADDPQASAEISAALRHPLFVCTTHDGALALWGCLNRVGFPFVAATDPADQEAPFLLVRTVGPPWFWTETRPHWKAAGITQPLHGGRGKRGRR
jgi:hypothetical protein